MANKASNAAYRQLTPLGNGISEDMKYWNNDGYKRREEERIDEANKIAADEKKKLEKDTLRKRVSKNLANYDTGSKSLNEVQGRLLQEAMQEYIPIMETLSDPNISEGDKLKAELRLGELHNLPENMKMVTDNVTKRHQDYLTGIQDGTIFRNQDYEKKFQNGYEAFALSLDENGLPVLAYRDTEGEDGINDIESYEEIKTGLGVFEFQNKFNTDDLAVSASSKIGEEDVETGSTYETTQIRQIKLEEVAKYAKNTMQDAKGNLTEVAKSELRTRDLEPTPDNIELIINDFNDLIKSKSDYFKKENYEAAALTSRLNSKDKDDKPKVTIGQGVTPTPGNWNAWYGKIDTGENLSVPVSGVKIEAIKNYAGKSISGLNVMNYTYDKYGTLLLDGYTQEEKSITKEDFNRQKEQAEKDNDQMRLALLRIGEIKGDRVVLPGKQEKIQVRVNKEDESVMAMQLGVSIEEMKSRATIPEDQKNEKKEDNPLDLDL